MDYLSIENIETFKRRVNTSPKFKLVEMMRELQSMVSMHGRAFRNIRVTAMIEVVGEELSKRR